MSRATLSKSQRLKTGKDFKSIFQKGVHIRGTTLSIRALRKNGQERRVAFSTRKKIGTAVSRNRARRLLREAYRRKSTVLPDNIDIVFIAEKAILHSHLTTVDSELSKLIEKLERRE